jgi:hypothetical protein
MKAGLEAAIEAGFEGRYFRPAFEVIRAELRLEG